MLTINNLPQFQKFIQNSSQNLGMKAAARQTLRSPMRSPNLSSNRPVTCSSNVSSPARPKTSMSMNISGNVSAGASPDRKNTNTNFKCYDLNEKNFLRDPVLISLREQFYDDPNPDFSNLDIQILMDFQRHMREFTQNCALSYQYDEAKESLNLSQLISHEIKNRNNRSKYSANYGEQILVRSDDEKDNNDNMTIEEFDRITEEKRANLLKLHSQQLQRFENVWNTQMPQKYRKPSPHYLQLKEQERALAASRNYQKANIFKLEAEKLALEETQEAQKRLVADYKSAKAQLLEKQAKELTNFEDNREHERLIIQQKLQEQKVTEMKREIVTSHKVSRNINFTTETKSSFSLPMTRPRSRDGHTVSRNNYSSIQNTNNKCDSIYIRATTALGGRKPGSNRNNSRKQPSWRTEKISNSNGKRIPKNSRSVGFSKIPSEVKFQTPEKLYAAAPTPACEEYVHSSNESKPDVEIVNTEDIIIEEENYENKEQNTLGEKDVFHHDSESENEKDDQGADKRCKIKEYEKDDVEKDLQPIDTSKVNNRTDESKNQENCSSRNHNKKIFSSRKAQVSNMSQENYHETSQENSHKSLSILETTQGKLDEKQKAKEEEEEKKGDNKKEGGGSKKGCLLI
ncbi:hypothetical protein TRFO_24880 [Tritrichomonas foetus]|uniref:Uncharacterized protein n=1 Tax=Tritrichomonas foetus TaxID=1144522 RepID=A0A1J4K7R7_9EUKA|nr:hypothetical protein TRFO_24880 [Tritrichomonas foetus]|eukprot:OHT06928.1 hypothetical protein TRFO_24880 [Tritrichomonas foetus]